MRLLRVCDRRRKKPSLTDPFPSLSPPRHLANRIGVNGARALADALKQNTTLTALSLNGQSELDVASWRLPYVTKSWLTGHFLLLVI